MASIPAFTLTTRKPALMRSTECLMDAKHVGQDFICFNFKDHPSAIGSTLDRKTARGFSCLLSVMTLWKAALVRRPPVTTHTKNSAWP